MSNDGHRWLPLQMLHQFQDLHLDSDVKRCGFVGEEQPGVEEMDVTQCDTTRGRRGKRGTCPGSIAWYGVSALCWRNYLSKRASLICSPKKGARSGLVCCFRRLHSGGLSETRAPWPKYCVISPVLAQSPAGSPCASPSALSLRDYPPRHFRYGSPISIPEGTSRGGGLSLHVRQRFPRVVDPRIRRESPTRIGPYSWLCISVSGRKHAGKVEYMETSTIVHQKHPAWIRTNSGFLVLFRACWTRMRSKQMTGSIRR